MHLKTLLPLAKAEEIANEVLRLGREEGMHPLTVVVLDGGGHVVVLKREDGSGIMRVDIATGKAWGALGMGIPSRLIRDRLGDRPSFQNALAVASEGRLIPVPGGVLIDDENGETIGAVGVSGDTSDKDEYCAIRAIAKTGLTPSPSEPAAEWHASKL
jgi:uncharacterized protein GlcG (DUF336 family)